MGQHCLPIYLNAVESCSWSCLFHCLQIGDLALRLETLQALSAADFLKVLEALLIVSGPCLGHSASIRDAVIDILAAARAPGVLQTEAQQVVDAALGG